MKRLILPLLLFSNYCIASDTGLVTYMSFASNITQTVRPGTVQFSIQGGFSQVNCNATYAAVAKEDSHLMSLILSAQAQNRSIEVSLDEDSKYYQDRCLVNYLILR